MSTIRFADHSPEAFANTADGAELPDDRQRFFRHKYIFDQLVGAMLLVLTSPLTLILALLVRLTSRGPAFYTQERVGLNGKTFYMIKLRSMVVDAEQAGKPVWCVKGDRRITPVGHVLRKLHLDELPQLLNVTRGEMSLVGPRPERPLICDSLAGVIDHYYQRVAVKPGVTGLSQINLPPDETVEDAMRKQVLDLCYIEEANAWLDFRLLVATGLRMFGIKGESSLRALRLYRGDLVYPERCNLVCTHPPQPAVNVDQVDSAPGPSLEGSLAFSRVSETHLSTTNTARVRESNSLPCRHR